MEDQVMYENLYGHIYKQQSYYYDIRKKHFDINEMVPMAADGPMENSPVPGPYAP